MSEGRVVMQEVAAVVMMAAANRDAVDVDTVNNFSI